MPMEEPLRLDVRLAEGFRFACRPDCGLCCYASPAVAEEEIAPLLAIAPEFHPGRVRPAHLPSRPDGGACDFLRHERCAVHSARPGPCAEFPLSAHLSDRIQVSVVLSCPGLTLDRLLGEGEGGPRGGQGIDATLAPEMSAVKRAAARLADGDRDRAARDWRRTLGERRPGDPVAAAVAEAIRGELRRDPPWPQRDDLAAVPIPSESEGLESLPMFFDAQFGRVALCATDDRVDLLALREGGGVEERLASYAYPERVPRVTEQGTRLVRAYLEYFADRDAFIGSALTRVDGFDPTILLETCEDDLREIAAATLSRAVYRSWLHGGSAETLDSAEIADGIRATDADYLDRPTLGRWL